MREETVQVRDGSRAEPVCAEGHLMRYDTENYATPRWVHVSIADLLACRAFMRGDQDEHET